MSLFVSRIPQPKDILYPDYYVTDSMKVSYKPDLYYMTYGTANCGDKYCEYDKWDYKSYAVDDIVGYEGRLYKCIQAASHVLPTDTDYWQDVSTLMANDSIDDVKTIEVSFYYRVNSITGQDGTIGDILPTIVTLRDIDTTLADYMNPSTAHADWMIGFLKPYDENDTPSIFIRTKSGIQYSKAHDVIDNENDSQESVNIPLSSFRKVNKGTFTYYCGTLALVETEELTIYADGVKKAVITREYLNPEIGKLPSILEWGMVYKSLSDDVAKQQSDETYYGALLDLRLHKRPLQVGELIQNALCDSKSDRGILTQ